MSGDDAPSAEPDFGTMSDRLAFPGRMRDRRICSVNPRGSNASVPVVTYSFEPGKIYRMPTHFGPAPGPRQIPPDARADPAQNPKKTIVSASFLTDPTKLEAHLPHGFSLIEPVVTVEFHYMSGIDWLAGHGYTMILVTWPAVFEGRKHRASGPFLAVVWENLPDPIITGRDEIGHPKLYADVLDLRIRNGTYQCEASWKGFTFLELEVSALRDADAVVAEKTADGTLMLKYIPRTADWGGTELCQVTLTPAANSGVTVENRQIGAGDIRFHRARWNDLPTMYHVINALAALPVLEARGGSVSWTRGGKSYRDQRVLE